MKDCDHMQIKSFWIGSFFPVDCVCALLSFNPLCLDSISKCLCISVQVDLFTCMPFLKFGSLARTSKSCSGNICQCFREPNPQRINGVFTPIYEGLDTHQCPLPSNNRLFENVGRDSSQKMTSASTFPKKTFFWTFSRSPRVKKMPNS